MSDAGALRTNRCKYCKIRETCPRLMNEDDRISCESVLEQAGEIMNKAALMGVQRAVESGLHAGRILDASGRVVTSSEISLSRLSSALGELHKFAIYSTGNQLVSAGAKYQHDKNDNDNLFSSPKPSSFGG